MPATFPHRAQHAVVSFRGELPRAAAVDLVDTVDTVLAHDFYREVERTLGSSGGLTGAPEHSLFAVARSRAAGVRVRTRAVESVASAAALMLALGDGRVAAPGASVVPHGVSVAPDSAVSVRESADIHAFPSRLNRTAGADHAHRGAPPAGSPRPGSRLRRSSLPLDAPPHRSPPTP